MKKIKIVITGVTGRMGMQIAKRVLKDKSLVLYGATERSGHKAIGKELGQLLKTKKLKSMFHFQKDKINQTQLCG